ncbi:MAG: hypothetical protein Pg6B_04390 [Candidatus Azobacteroides pseudotrichonymphae]|uniref:Uncharacterized protein n=1 Tax=Candidatus Improbicoccus pseudotrichonymphae TaxID=3033792 RepID=A0AA48IA26_9FIRM|nr:MAG: hypothetical protein CfP315_0182 [Candidatus Improbicoccus pseudotrichonymphae]GMO33984.1 MAG: hypothetical protein Pg6B_04390 [Candidatus Azobacteroides pseudotrichonymphae]
MQTDQQSETVYFNTKDICKIGNITYIIESHFKDEGETVVDKIKNLIKTEIWRSDLNLNDV